MSVDFDDAMTQARGNTTALPMRGKAPPGLWPTGRHGVRTAPGIPPLGRATAWLARVSRQGVEEAKA